MAVDESANKHELEDAVRIYDLYRDYVKHEDELINRRLSWNLTLQGFLFATYGVSFQVLGNSAASDELKRHIKLLACALPVIGGSVAILALLSILAAQASIDELKIRWAYPAGHIREDVLEMLPGLTGAGRRFANRWGKIPQVGIPCVMIAAWIFLLWIAASHKI